MIDNLQKLTVKSDNRYIILKGLDKPVYYILWNWNDLYNKNIMTEIKNTIKADFKYHKKLWWDEYKIYELQFKINNGELKFAMRKVDRKRKNNRLYFRNNISFGVCSECGELLDKDNIEVYNNYMYCDTCYDDKFGTCCNCGDIIDNDELREGTDGNMYCDKCFAIFFTFCEGCEDVIDNPHAYTGIDGCCYCENCFYDRYSTCQRCGDTVYQDDLYYDEDNDEYLCQNCYDGGLIHSHAYKPDPVFQKEKWENTLYTGFELEVERKQGESRKVFAEDLTNYLTNKHIDNRFYFKNDSSIQNGFEIVSHPTTLKAYKKYNLKDMLEFIKKYATSHDNGNCGLHFHINADFFKNRREIHKLILFFNNCYTQLKKFSKRTDSQIRNYCKFKNFGYDDYKFFENKNRGLCIYNDDDGEPDRYMAVNLTNEETVEIRIFRGTLRYDRFLADLQFIDAIAHFVKIASFRSMTWAKFIEYLRYTNRYNHLEKFLKQEELI